MTTYEILSLLNMAVIALSIALVLRLMIKGQLSEHSLQRGPTRNLHQPAWVYATAVIGVMLYSFCKLFVRGEQPTEVLVFIELIPYLLVGLMLGRAKLAEAGLRKVGILPRWPKRDTMWGLVGGIVGLGLASGVGLAVNLISTALGYPVDPVAHQALQSLRDEFSIELLIALIVSAVIIAPLIEEMVFRGVFQTSLIHLCRETRWPALIIASTVFSMIHWSVVAWQGLVPLFVLGLVFGYLYERTGSLLSPILAHAVFNAANIIIALNIPDNL